MLLGCSTCFDRLRVLIMYSNHIVACNYGIIQAKAFWVERKRMLDLEWAASFRRLPKHVQSVLGPKKNLLLLREMLLASESPDDILVDDLMQGFPLVGNWCGVAFCRQSRMRECDPLRIC